MLEAVTQGISGDLSISLWYPPSGLSVALLLFLGLRYWPAVAATSLLHVALFRQGLELPPTAAVGYAVGYPALLAAGCALFLGRITSKVRADARLVRLHDVVWFVVILCLALPLAIDVAAVSLYTFVGAVPGSDFWPNVLGAWAGDATGIAAVVPLLAVVSRSFPALGEQRRRDDEGPEPAPGLLSSPRGGWYEFAGQAALLALTAWAAYGASRGIRLDYAYLVFLPLIWVAGRSGFERTVLFMFVTNVGAVLLAGASSATSPVLLQFGLMAVTLIGLLSGAAVSEQHRSRARLEESERRFRSVVHNASEVVEITDPDGRIRYASPALERLFGHDPEAAGGTNVLDYVHPEDLEFVRERYERALENGSAVETAEYRFRCADGSYKPVEAVSTYLLDDPALKGVVINVRDATERRAYEERLEHQAFHDGLTGLPNRALLLDRLEQALERTNAARGGGCVGVLFLDLDDFKDVNDALGHEAGDELLVAVAGRLREAMRPRDTVARLGGDEFCVLVESPAEDAGAGEASGAALEVAERILLRLSEQPFGLAGNGEAQEEVRISASVGIALSSSSGDRASGLLKEADIAMYRAKKDGGGCSELFERGLAEGVGERLRLRRELARALERGELELFYQPQVSLATGEVLRMEALLRWRHPERGLLLPGEFVPLAEETGLIVPVGRWVVGEALARHRTWRRDLAPPGSRRDSPPGAIRRVPGMCVNLSARQLRHEGLVEEVGGLLKESGTDPEDFGLEVTESVLAEGERPVASLRRLREMGLSISLDDFGTGYSSLAYLKSLPADVLKIDCSFVRDLESDPQDAAMVSSMVGLADATGKRVVAECVESPKQLSMLGEAGCEAGQGNLFSEPLPPEEAAAFLANYSPRGLLGDCSG